MMYIEQAPLGGNLLQIIKNSASLSNGAGAEGTERKVNGDSSIQNGSCQTTKPLKPAKKIDENKTNECVNLEDAKESVVTPDEEEEQYELIDIIEEPEQSDLEGSESKNPNATLSNGYEIEINIDDFKDGIEKNRQEQKEIVSRAALVENDNIDEYEYQLVKVAKRKSKEPADLIPLFESKTKLRPVPDAIPIDFVEKNNKTKRLLNGISKRQEVTGTYESQHRSLNGGCFTSCLTERTAAVGDGPLLDKQMGIDILSGLRQLFNWKSKTDSNQNTETTETQNIRKRRSENQATVAHFKYRKVDNNFPEVITQSLDDDTDFSAAYPKPSLNSQQYFKNTAKFSQQKQSKPEMTQRGTEQKSRNSWFKIPQIKTKTVRNTSYADYEFSDDDDEEARNLQKSLGMPSLNGGNLRKQPKVTNIPIIKIQEKTQSTAFFKPTINTSHSIFNINSGSKPTYAETLKYSSAFGNGIGHVLNGHSLSSNVSTGSGPSTSRLANDYANMTRLSNKALGRSILAQDRAREEHEKYKQLLDTINQAQAIYNYTPNTVLLGNLTKKPRVSSKFNLPTPMRRAPLSSTINIDDDESYDDVAITGVTTLKPHKSTSKKRDARIISTVILDGDEEISEIIDLEKEQTRKKTMEIIDLDAKENKHDELPYVEPVNSFRDILNTIPHLKDNWFKNFTLKWEEKKKLREAEVNKTLEITEKLTAERRAADTEIRERLQDFRIVDPELLVVDDFAEKEDEKEREFPELNKDRMARINAAVYGSPDQVLVEKFNMKITRRDIQTLLGHNWLNDEVINFYMNLITERSEIKQKTHGYPAVYAMNTFFLQRLSQNGHGGVKRWTRKVNIFEKDILPVPVHVGGVHWCMAIIHLKDRFIRYYDSMGAPNPSVLKLLEQYLKDESLDKRKQTFDTSDFVIESVRDVPRQMNGSDCGVFSCMFAEYISRNKKISFSQQQMEYFRHKMILEIVQGELLL